MERSKRMRKITDMVDTRVREATRLMAESRRAHEQSEAQLGELRRYRDEYRKKSAEYQGAGDPRRLNEYRVFLQRLDEAIRHQEQVVAQARVDLDRKTAEWRGYQTHAKALEKVTERFESDEQKTADRREQKEQDEVGSVFRLTDRD